MGEIKIHASIASSGFVLRGYTNPRCPPKNKIASLALFNGEDSESCSTARAGLRAITHGVQGAEGSKAAAPITMFLQIK
jgi:hypothetical protein